VDQYGAPMLVVAVVAIVVAVILEPPELAEPEPT
jgi:hypothetical protein